MPGSKSPTSSLGSRKVSTEKQSPSTETSYAFLNFSHPAEAKDQKARRTVRSHVTRQQHQKEQLAAAATRRSSSFPQALETPQYPHPEGRAPAASFPLAHSEPGYTHELGSDHQSPASGSSPATSVASSPVSPRLPANPSQLYPSHWIPYINVVLDHYVVSMTHNVLNTRDQTITDALRTTWMPFVFTDVALLHATLLIGASFYSSPSGPRSHPFDVLQLKGMTISAINDSIQDPIRSVSDQIIAAVLSIAHYEAFWGETQAFAFHMGAVRNMVQMRGGLTEIGPSLHGLLERIVLSVDYHTSRVTGASIAFDPALFQSNIQHPALGDRGGSTLQPHGQP